MKNLSKKVVVLLALCTFTVSQVSASPLFSIKAEKSDSQYTTSAEAYTKIIGLKTWLVSFFNKKDYVAEDMLLTSYMLGKARETVQLSEESEESLLSNYMYGESNDNTIAYSYDAKNISFAADLEEDICENDFGIDFIEE